MLQRIIGDDVSVGVRFAQGLAPVEADRAQIERVILNLAANARDAMPDGGRLTIETANVELDADYVASHGEGSPGPHVMLAVSDTGSGMSADVQRHLFEPFFTTKPPAPAPASGSRPCSASSSRAAAASTSTARRARGRRSRSTSPRPRRSARRAGAAVEDASGSRGSETILVVEDDPRVRDLVRIMLEASGYRVVAAAGAAEAEQVCAAGGDGIDLVLTDVVMPGVNGRALAERLVELSPATRVLFMSGYSDEAVQHHGVIRQESAFVEKPFTALALTRKVRELLDRPL